MEESSAKKKMHLTTKRKFSGSSRINLELLIRRLPLDHLLSSQPQQTLSQQILHAHPDHGSHHGNQNYVPQEGSLALLQPLRLLISGGHKLE